VTSRPHLARVRLDDVARAAGVSKGVASKILNESPGLHVRDSTRARVLRIAKKLDYQPHAVARRLRTAETGSIGMLIPDLTGPVYARIVRGAFQRALERDFAVLLVEDLVLRNAAEVITRLIRGGRMDGLIVASARQRHPLLPLLKSSPIPHVFANRAVRGSGRNVILDEAAAARAAVHHLHWLGHRRIGHLGGPPTLDPAARRAKAFRRAITELGLGPATIVVGEFSEAGGAVSGAALLTGTPDLTAVYSSSLAQTVGLLHAASELGIRVPDDLSVVSHDDMPIAEYLSPPITAISRPLAELGAAAVDALIEQLDGQRPRDIVVPGDPQVVDRRSTAPPRT
jgi:DNA-binding LacI/PurR family transcriptional regulator